MLEEMPLDGVKSVLLGLNAVLFLALLATFATQSRRSPIATAAESTATGPKRALLVTAHPDDESMFFLPLVHSMTAGGGANAPGKATDWDLHLLCLSRGNFDGLGETREREMRTCGEFLGLDARHLRVLEDPKLQDGMQAQWDPQHIARLVLDYIDQHQIHAVFTFDDYGVSGHPNHIAVHHGVKTALFEQHRRCDDEGTGTKPIKGWALESTGLLRKYIGVLDALVFPAVRGSATRVFVLLFRPLWNYHAMALHHSQFVWYRRLFVIFSRYTFINTFQPLLPPSDVTVAKAETAKKDD